jgi:hypothetical protein
VSAITESARGEDCTIRLESICNFRPETTVWCHANGSAAGKGMWMKAPDLLGAYGCSSCHDAYDRRNLVAAQRIHSREHIELAFWEGHARSVLKLIEKGIVVLVRGKTTVQA